MHGFVPAPLCCRAWPALPQTGDRPREHPGRCSCTATLLLAHGKRAEADTQAGHTALGDATEALPAPGEAPGTPSTREPRPAAAQVLVQLSIPSAWTGDALCSAQRGTLRAPAEPSPGVLGMARLVHVGCQGCPHQLLPSPGPCRLQMDAIKLILQRPIIAVSSAWQHDPGSPHYTNHCHTNTIAEHIKTWCASC